jgi:Flp pilus assembly protein TadG
MTVMTAVALDATIFTMAFARIDATTRDAARAAANQQTSAQALKAAQTQLATHSTDGVFIRQPVLTGTTSPYFVYQDYGGTVPPGPPYVSPYVSVSCSEDVYLPVPISFMGASFSGFLKSGNHLTLSKQYVFPIVKMKYY